MIVVKKNDQNVENIVGKILLLAANMNQMLIKEILAESAAS